MIALKIIICLVVGYLFGSISTAFIIGKINHIDIRTQGSGNAGTTNAMRTLGKKAGIYTYLGDILKTLLPIFIFINMFSDDLSNSLIALITGFGVVLGHNYPFWLKFKGGKGIAVTSAVIFVYCSTHNPLLVLFYIALFACAVYVTKYVSVSSLLVVTAFLIHIVLFSSDDEHYLVNIIMGVLFCASAFFAHRSNIKRLLNGTENKVGGKKNE